MAIKITRWSPDTCGCELEYRWDDSVPDNQRTHTLDNYVRQCSAHSSLANDNDRYNSILDENPRKNIALLDALNNVSGLRDVTADGGFVLKPNINYNFSFTGTAPNRVLNISFSGISLTTQQRNGIQAALNARFGSGKVLLS